MCKTKPAHTVKSAQLAVGISRFGLIGQRHQVPTVSDVGILENGNEAKLPLFFRKSKLFQPFSIFPFPEVTLRRKFSVMRFRKSADSARARMSHATAATACPGPGGTDPQGRCALRAKQKSIVPRI